MLRFAAEQQSIVNEFNLVKVPEKTRELTKRILRTPARTAMDAGLKFSEDHSLNVAKFDQISPVSDPTSEAFYTAQFAQMSHPEKIEAGSKWPIQGIVAVARIGWQFWKIDESAWATFTYRIREHNLTNAPAVQATFTKLPSIEHPLARGVDPDKVKDYVQSALQIWKDREQAISDASFELQKLAYFVASACSINATDAWNLLFEDA